MATARDIAQVAYQAGFRGNELVTAVAIALTEDPRRDPNALNNNPSTGDYSVGYWQINYYGILGPDRTKKYGPPSNLMDTNPTGPGAYNNAKAAYAISGGGKSFNAWTTYTSGAYKANYNEAYQAVNSFMGGPVAAGAVGSPGSNSPTPASVSPPQENKCLVSIPVLGCVIHDSQARAVLGGLILAGGVTVSLVGLILLVGRKTDLTALIGTTPAGKVAAVAASRKASSSDRKLEREIDRGSTPTPQQQREARARYRAETVKDADGNDF